MSNQQYLILVPGKNTAGPYDEETIKELYRAGEYPEGTLAWCEGMEDWAPLVNLFGQPANSVPPANDVTPPSAVPPIDVMPPPSAVPPIDVMPPPSAVPPPNAVFPKSPSPLANVFSHTSAFSRAKAIPPANTATLPGMPPPPPSNAFPAIPEVSHANAGQEFVKEYYVIGRDQERKGPYSAADIKELVKSGAMPVFSMAWKPGMDAWARLDDILDVRPFSYYMTPLSWTVFGFFCLEAFLDVILLFSALGESHKACEGMARYDSWAFVIGNLLMLGILYKTWETFHQGLRDWILPSPGKAIGFLFIPVFSFYWLFVTYGRVSILGNRLLKRNAIPRFPFLALCILLVADFVADLIRLYIIEECSRSALYSISFIYALMMIGTVVAAVLCLIHMSKLIISYNRSAASQM